MLLFVTQADRPYNPLDRVELGLSVERALLARPLVPLPPQDRFGGAGLYAIYYVGEFRLYAHIAPPSRDPGSVPIYVGRAQPRGARKGLSSGLTGTTSDPVLFERLREHAQSIRKVERHATEADLPGIRLQDFWCRHLVVDDIWVPMGEALLIGHYRPVWNVVIDGFGIHQPGGGRDKQARSAWDELHPGRPWALTLPPARNSVTELWTLVAAHLTTPTEPDLNVPPSPGDLDAVESDISDEPDA